MEKWKNIIEVKHTFVDNPKNEDIAISCRAIIWGMNKINKIPKYLEDDFENIKDNFEIILDCCNGDDIVEDYGFPDGELEWFNSNLDWLYNIGDDDKFIWIK